MMNSNTRKVRPGEIVRLFFSTFKAAPPLFLAFSIFQLLSGVSLAALAPIQQRFFDAATALHGTGEGISGVALPLAAFGAMLLFSEIINGFSNFGFTWAGDKAEGVVTYKMQEKAAKLSAVEFEDTKKLDYLNMAEKGVFGVIGTTLVLLVLFMFYIPYFLCMGWYLFTLKPVFLVAIVVVFVPTALTQLIRTKAFSDAEKKSAPLRRELDHYEQCIADRDYFKETRLLGGFRFFRRLYRECLIAIQKMQFKATVKSGLFELTSRVFTIAGYAAILLMLFRALLDGEVSIGAFSAVFSSIGSMYSLMEEIICSHLSVISRNAGPLSNYIDFMNMPERGGEDIELPREFDITLENVSFSYPNTDARAVEDVSLTIKGGETLAIVGENGSGKTTMVRLITGLYAPLTGSVAFAGINTSSISNASLFARTSAVFQKYQKYKMNLGENILISDMHSEVNMESLDSASALAGVDPNDLQYADGYNTMLSREFDGMDISGGQWQRVAIGRAFYRTHDLIVLDEPTAAIDPNEEKRIFNKFAELTKDNTTIIVTHRLGSVRLADRIAVMKEGRLVQLGTHDELIALDGEYSRLYHAQQQWYSED